MHTVLQKRKDLDFLAQVQEILRNDLNILLKYVKFLIHAEIYLSSIT